MPRIVTTLITFLLYTNALFGADWFAYVPNSGDNTIVPINLTTNVPGTPINNHVTASAPSNIAITPNALKAYVTNNGTSNVTPIDLLTNTIGPLISVGTSPIGVAITPEVESQVVFVTNNGSNSITIIDVSTDIPFATINLGTNNNPYGVAITPKSFLAYITVQGSGSLANTVVRFDTRTHLLIGSPIPVSDPFGIAITPDGTKAYVANFSAGTVTPIDLITNTALTPIPVGSNPFHIAITANGNTAFVTNQGDNTVTPIDVATDTPGAPIVLDSIPPFGQAPHGIAITPDSQTAYVSDLGSDDVTPISTTTFTPGTPIPLAVGAAPFGIAITPDQAPTASFTSTPGLAGSPTVFDASASSSPVGTISIFAWDFGDGSTATVFTPITNHTYNSAGNFNVTLTVTNSGGTSTTQTFTGQTVSNNGGPSAIFSSIVIILPRIPTVTNVNPNVGPTEGGNFVTITGTDFINVISVNFGSTAASFSVISSTTIIATAPPGSVGTVDVRVTTISGTSPITVNDQYTYKNASSLPPLPPSNFIAIITKNKFLTQSVCILSARWNASPSTNVTLYRIFKNGSVVKEVPATSPLVFKTSLENCSGKGFEIAAVSSNNLESTRVKLKIVKDL